MNHTKNYSLPQWELNDLIRMEDFNSMNASIENGLTAAATAANQAASTAETARQTAVAAFRPGNLPYTVGSYTGDGSTVREFVLGFRPSFLLICHSQFTYALSHMGQGMAMAGPSVTSEHIYFTEQGFRLESLDPINIYPDVNVTGTLYNYIAFR